MALRLLFDPGEQEQRCVLRAGENLVGSAADCDIVIAHPTVSRHHAVLVLAGESIQVADLDSANGTFVNHARVHRPTDVTSETPLTFGTVEARLETLPAGDVSLSPAVAPAHPAALESTAAAAPTPTTASTHPLQLFSLGLLPRLLELVQQQALPIDVAQAAGTGLLDLFGGSVTVRRHSQDRVLFASKRRATTPEPSAEDEIPRQEITLHSGDVSVSFTAPPSQQQVAEPLLRTVAGLVDLAIRRESSPPTHDTPAPTGALEHRTLDPAMRKLLSDARRIARGDVSVLVLGESGTGKEVMARFVHEHSRRADQPLLALNCAALPNDLLEAELFGIEGGVATGVNARAGRFEQADGGTLFLDEIGDMSASVQAKLLRVLEGHEVYRVGGTTPRSANVRIIAATNRDLAQMIEAGEFRLDLYHRISDWECSLPPLRERIADIPNLIAFFIEREATLSGRQLRGVSERALEMMLGHSWPGNVRELEREVRRAALLLDDGGTIDSTTLSKSLQTESGSEPASLQTQLDQAEREAMERALVASSGQVAAAAERLQVPVSTFYRKLKKFDLAPQEPGET